MARRSPPAFSSAEAENRATVAAGFVAGMLSGLRARGVDPLPLLAGAGLGREHLEGPRRTPLGAYAALYNAERRQPGARVRILHYGDSPTTADLITADVRTLLQDRFGDAGHGVHLIAKRHALCRNGIAHRDDVERIRSDGRVVMHRAHAAEADDAPCDWFAHGRR